jgi:homoserine O-succinyltransferase
MPLVSNSKLPAFQRLQSEGESIVPAEIAVHQDIRELHIGLLNMMPDAALEATERQFFRLIGESNQIAQFYMHPFTLNELSRSQRGQEHIEHYYQEFNEIKEQGLDALIITGANVTQPELSKEPFWSPLIEVIDWAYENVTSTICSCLATHAVMEFRYQQKRQRLPEKKWGVFSHKVMDRSHPLVSGVNTRFDVPHSRFNEINRHQFERAGLHVLVEGEQSGVHLAVSEDLFRLVFFQGHPEYDAISLLKEYKREVVRYINGDLDAYPPFPVHYFCTQSQAILEEYRLALESGQATARDFPEQLLVKRLDNTWHDSAEAVINNWIGKVYQVTNNRRELPFMEGIDRNDPLGLKT